MARGDIALHVGYDEDRFISIQVGEGFNDKFVAFFERIGDENPSQFRLHIALHGRIGDNIGGTLEDFESFILELNSRIGGSPFFQQYQISSCVDFSQIAIGGDFNFSLATAEEDQVSHVKDNRVKLEKFLALHFPNYNFDMYYPAIVRSRKRADNILDNAQFFKHGAMDAVANEVVAACFATKCEASKKREPEVKFGASVVTKYGSELSFSFALEAEGGVSCLDHQPLIMTIDGETFVYANVIACSGWAGIRKDTINLTDDDRARYAAGLQRMFASKALDLARNLKAISVGGDDKLDAVDDDSVVSRNGHPGANFSLLTKRSWNVKGRDEDGSIEKVRVVVKEFFRQVLLSEEYQVLVQHLFAGDDGEKLCNKLLEDDKGDHWKKVGSYYKESDMTRPYLEHFLDRLMHNFGLSSKGKSFTVNNLINDIVGGLEMQRGGGYEVSPTLARELRDQERDIKDITQEIYRAQEKELSEIIKAAEVVQPVIVGIEVRDNPYYAGFTKTLEKCEAQILLQTEEGGRSNPEGLKVVTVHAVNEELAPAGMSKRTVVP